MADPSRYTYESPLKGYENAPPLPDEKAADGKSKYFYFIWTSFSAPKRTKLNGFFWALLTILKMHDADWKSRLCQSPDRSSE